MHRFSSCFWLLSAAALYVSDAASATPPYQPPPQPQAQSAVFVSPATSLPVQIQSDAPAQLPLNVEPQSQSKTQSSDVKQEPHIALLLPLKSTSFGRAAEAVQMGFLAAAASQLNALPIKVYGSFDESKDISAIYQSAVNAGAVAVAGPLTRDGVVALAKHSRISVPTLALNFAETKNADQLYFFGLTMDAEARQVAQLAAAAKLRYATIVSTATPLTKRLSQAFADEWQSLGGSITAEILYKDDPTVLANIPAAPNKIAAGKSISSKAIPGKSASGKTSPDPDATSVIAPGNMVFLAADAERARLIRPYLNAALPVYATSQLFSGNTDTFVNYDLHGIHFVDMPWLLQPDHPAVMIYPRANPPLEPDRERLYALGVDAFRLVQILLSDNYRAALPLDGVTGRISLITDNQFRRDAMPAQIRQGHSQSTTPLPNSPVPKSQP